MPRHPSVLLIACAALMACEALAGCALIDQTTFAPEADPKPAPVAVAPPPAPVFEDKRVPLMTIRYDVPAPDYRTVLALAVHTAQQRRPGVGFDVVSVVPQAGEAPQGQVDAGEIARAIAKLGTPATRTSLALRIDPAITPREVLVYPR